LFRSALGDFLTSIFVVMLNIRSGFKDINISFQFQFFHFIDVNLQKNRMVRYFEEDICFDLKDKMRRKRWIAAVAAAGDRRIGALNFIFCSDPYLLEINRRYLGHDYYTDIITFDYCEGKVLAGDLFISIDTVRENASFYGSRFEDELDRVMIHGVLHLIGYDDHTEADQKEMRRKEEESLKLRDFA